MAIDPIQLTRQLVNIDSTTYHEGLAGVFLHEFLAAQRYDVERQAVPQPAGETPGAGKGERFNVYAALPGVTPDVVLSTHMDTVPPFFGCTEDDEFLHGRGTCDAKGIIAAQVAAADRLRNAGVKVGLLFVVGEERDSAGAQIANLNPKGSKFLINGEPTDNRLALATKGALRVELRCSGRMAHSAYPELGESAIDKLLEALHDVMALPLPAAISSLSASLLGGMTFILVSTMYPKISELWGESATVGPPHFNRWMGPIGLVIFALMGLAPLFGWRKTSGQSIKKAFRAPVIAMLTVIVLHAIFGRSLGYPPLVARDPFYPGLIGIVIQKIGSTLPAVIQSPNASISRGAVALAASQIVNSSSGGGGMVGQVWPLTTTVIGGAAASEALSMTQSGFSVGSLLRGLSGRMPCVRFQVVACVPSWPKMPCGSWVE